MAIFLFIFFVLFILWSIVGLFMAQQPRRDFTFRCDERGAPHEWSYNYKDQLQCTKCNMVAGQITLKDDPYDF